VFTKTRRIASTWAAAVALLTASLTHAGAQTVRFAVIGDYGSDGANEASVAFLVKSWSPDFVITVGDNNYPSGYASTIDVNIGKHYQQFIGNYKGAYGTGSSTNRFWPTLGNHDWGGTIPNPTGANPYLAYFTLPGNERYYDFTSGPVHLFALDSDGNEPDGTSSSSLQAGWLQARMTASSAPWKLVYFHHPPYSSGQHGSAIDMRWPFEQWGASAVLAGHDHTYERLSINGFPYFVNGLGGRSIYSFGTPISGSVYRYNASYGAMLVTATSTSIRFEFYNTAGTRIDSLTLTKGGVAPSAPTGLDATALSSNQIRLDWTDRSSNENGFYVERLTNSVWTRVATLAPNTSAYTSTGLTPFTRYSYRVQAFNDAGVSAYTNSASARTRRM
jgi:tartrate-resistant acid phosphatase type 5